ncbi:hypothetical protein ARMGADRAFT_1003755 [Armillaria gallica]|uniref:Heterokaryon incompatibility domain-containing protein n=1 Tax=Armillaria gallica TaxID=47427 RepID=A0A2H3C867_ARMGA|nr:hypothetical protein ARMGADRAFT_1003755 [Armillaria gallica]
MANYGFHTTPPYYRIRKNWIEVTEKYRKDGSGLFTYANFLGVTISAFTEIGQADEDIIVPLQRIYTGTMPVISSSLADTPCAVLGRRGLLKRLNATLGTSHTLDNPTFFSLLQDCIAKNYDFGTAYGFLRPAWYSKDWSSIPDIIRECEEKDREMRQSALRGSEIVDPHIYPRPYPHPISHAWVQNKDRVDVWTPINGREWPVPIPKDTNLDLVRIEMLNKGLEYVWLDVLCLRQEGGPREDLRVEEWKLDVPTIGALYNVKKVHCYLNGLGRPLSVENDYFSSDRCWFNRAWTLQETGSEGYEVCGITLNGPLDAKPDKDGKYDTEVLTTFHRKLLTLKRISSQPFEVLEEMQRRVSTKPVDRIAAIAILLWSSTIPAYNESHTLEDAWTALLNVISPRTRAALFFWFPEPGIAGATWRPSWKQVMKTSLPKDYPSNEVHFMAVRRDNETKTDQCDEAFCIEKCFVRGLAVGGALGTDRHGELLVRDAFGIQHAFHVVATHQYPIPENTYTLIRYELSYSRSLELGVQWVVGERFADQRFKKLSVLTMAAGVVESMLKDLQSQEEKRVNVLV